MGLRLEFETDLKNISRVRLFNAGLREIIFKYKMDTDKDKDPSVENVIIEEKITKGNGQVSVNRYSKGKLLGKGGFAKCYEITNIETKKVMAAKIIAKSTLNRSRAKQKLISEIKIHKALSHIHIVKFEHVFEDQENVYIMLEICSNQTLNELIKRRKRLTELEVMYYLQQLVSSLKYLHMNKIIHRDLKLGNLFLNENMEIKLGDFGLATRLEYNEEKKKTICGTPNYIAPEILENKGHSYEVDVWSIGVIIYTQLIGKPPFETNDVKATYRRIKACSYTFPENADISQNAKNLIRKILVLDPSKRPTLQQIMQDPFMTSESIPKALPRSALACPPAKTFLKQNQDIPRQPAAPAVKTEEKYENKMFQEDKKAKAKVEVPAETGHHNEVYVKKWVDYSTKYGLGYLLSDGSTGVYFNDATKILLDPKGENFNYVEKKSGQKADAIQVYSLKNYPDGRELQKKVTLLQHFRNYLYADYKKDASLQGKELVSCYVKKWMKTKHAIMFRLSNKIVQVNFTDKTEIILSSQQRLVTYMNLKGEKSEYPLATALDSPNHEMAKRLKYTKEILTHMLNGTSLPAHQMSEPGEPPAMPYGNS